MDEAEHSRMNSNYGRDLSRNAGRLIEDELTDRDGRYGHLLSALTAKNQTSRSRPVQRERNRTQLAGLVT